MSTKSDSEETFQIPLDVAEFYEQRFVPALFAEWAPVILDAASVADGDRLLDVACGTGIVARTARQARGDAISITGVDLNEAMLTVAARNDPTIDWRQGDVGELPFADDSFDATVCQMAFMFFPDRLAAFAEMARVTRPGGRIAVVVPAALDTQPAYAPFVAVSADHVGAEARSLLGTYWNCGNLAAFTSLAEKAGISGVQSRGRAGSARFESVRDFVDTEIDASPLSERVTPEQRSAIVEELEPTLDTYRDADGRLSVPIMCHVVWGRVGPSSRRE